MWTSGGSTASDSGRAASAGAEAGDGLEGSQGGGRDASSDTSSNASSDEALDASTGGESRSAGDLTGEAADSAVTSSFTGEDEVDSTTDDNELESSGMEETTAQDAGSTDDQDAGSGTGELDTTDGLLDESSTATEDTGNGEEDTTDASTESGGSTCVRQLCASENAAAAADEGLTAVGNLIAYPVQLGLDIEQVLGVEVYTGTLAATHAFSIWSDFAGLPFAERSRVTWGSVSTNAWQGADFPRGVDIEPGTRFWVVWHPPAGVQANVATSGPNTFAKVSTDNGFTWVDNTTPRPAMLKLYCCVASER